MIPGGPFQAGGPGVPGPQSGGQGDEDRARLKLSPSKWTIFGSVRSEPPGGHQVPPGRPGRNASSQRWKARSGSTLHIKAASSRQGDRKSSPPGSQDRGPRSDPGHTRPGRGPAISASKRPVLSGAGIVQGQFQTEGGVRVNAGPDGVGLLRQESFGTGPPQTSARGRSAWAQPRAAGSPSSAAPPAA